MSRERWVIISLFVLGLAFLIGRWVIVGHYGRMYVDHQTKSYVQVYEEHQGQDGKVVKSEPKWVLSTSEDLKKPDVVKTGKTAGWVETKEDPNPVHAQPGAEFSLMSTLGVWISAFLTLSILSFTYRDNPFYKTAEAIFIGVSAGYTLVVNIWDMIIPNLAAKLLPGLIHNWALPGLDISHITWQDQVLYLVPLALSVMLLWRLAPKGGWIARWPLAFFVGVFSGLKMVSYIQSDFLKQVKPSIIPLVVVKHANNMSQIDWSGSIWNIVATVSLLACLTYFFFSIEHKGVVSRVARFGTWVLMITFGAMFGFTVMGRIALLTDRFDFLFHDWLWIGRFH